MTSNNSERLALHQVARDLKAHLFSVELRLAEVEERVRIIATGNRSCPFPIACRLLLRTGKISPAQLVHGKQDLLVSAIVETLLLHSDLSLSELATTMKLQFGRADRKTIRGRLGRLIDMGIVCRQPEFGRLNLTPEFIEKWLRFVSDLAIPSRNDIKRASLNPPRGQ